MNRILLDQGLAPRAAAILRQQGLDTVHVSEIGMERAEDIHILERARTDERVCVTLDHDFHTHLAVSGKGALRWCCCESKAWTRMARPI
jgi:predicted nuclease of predicted toxin-antitoxin system